MSTTNHTTWGENVHVETIHGIPYRMYAQRPHSVTELIAYASRWDRVPYILHRERSLCFAEWRTAVTNKARVLDGLGVEQGDRVLLLGWNSAEWVVNFWACLQAGAVPVLANAWWSAKEIADSLALLQPTLILADPKTVEKLPDGSKLGAWELDGNLDPAASAARQTHARHMHSEEDTAIILFTSGTSGQPKAVVLSHRAVLARLHMTLHVTRKLPQHLQAPTQDVTLITGPLFHVGGMQTLLRAAMVGETLALPDGRFDPGHVLALIARHKVTRWNAVPTMVTRLLDQLDHPDMARHDLASLKAISIGGAPVHAELMQRIRKCLPNVSPRIPTGYGLTENGGQATASAGSQEKLGSTGRPLPCVEIAFRSHPGLPDGEVLLRSPTQMSGYYGTTESPIDAQGWLHTGDLGHLDAQGQLWITGRSKDMIIRGGENIAPAAIESALLRLPSISDCVVFGIPHRDLGEEVMAIVVTHDINLTPGQLQQDLRGTIASFAIPSHWRIQHEPLPANPAGKVDKAAIRAQVHAELQRQG